MRGGHDTLVALFERIENFFERLGTYTKVLVTAGMTGVLVKIVAGVLPILSIATKEAKRKLASELFL